MASREFVVENENFEEILAEIKSLRQDDEANGRWNIRLCGIEYTHIVSRAILQAFSQCSTNGINFGSLHMYGLYGRDLEMERVLLDANTLSLFTSIDVHVLDLSGGAVAAFWGASRMNQRLQILTIDSGGILFSSKSPLQCLNLRDSKLFEDAAMILAAGLKANTTLQAIRIATTSGSVGGHALKLAEVMTALTGHPNLLSFELAGFVIHDEAGRALEHLLSAPNCKIERLVLPRIDWETNGETVYRGLRQCKSLEMISIHCKTTMFQLRFENAAMINFLNAVLRNCPRLESINLNDNNISSLVKLNTLAPMEQPSKIREFFIDKNPVWKNANDADRDALLYFVRSSPELIHLAEYFDFAESELYTPLTGHYLDLNRSGRILLSVNISRPGIPLSVWPVVLERANQLFQEKGGRQANVLYHLLDGPAFRARDSFPNVEKRQQRDA